MKRNGHIISAVIIGILALMLVSCGKKEQEASDTYRVYYPDSSYTSLLSEEAVITEGDIAGSLLGLLAAKPANATGVAAISGNVVLMGWEKENGRMVLDFADTYSSLKDTEEVLTRAAIVETLVQDESIHQITFLVDGAELTDRKGRSIGDMTADSFITNTGEELNSYARTNVTLYFTDVTGSGLKRYDEDIVYTSNMSVEKLAVETLIKGPAAVEEPDAYPTISPDAKLLSVTVKDRIAYVNFDASIREEPYSVQEDVVLYSIVNTLTSLPGVDQVQISVEGSTEGVLFDAMKLDALYERNDDLIM
ncbi:MAG: GerMN domain-containing protein [Lachnospiraceae bacterium]|nr:GerMN domain-containing protein [Lachnospiraceae bacterium]